MKRFAEKSTNKQNDVSWQPTGKWIECISQSGRALYSGYIIILSGAPPPRKHPGLALM